MRAVDTNILVRLIAQDDAGQVRAAEAFIAPGAWVSHLALAEATWVLRSVYDVAHRQMANALDVLMNHQALTIQDREVVVAALELFRQKPRLGFTDCLLLEIGRKAGHAPLGTFDRALGKMPGAQQL